MNVWDRWLFEDDGWRFVVAFCGTVLGLAIAGFAALAIVGAAIQVTF